MNSLGYAAFGGLSGQLIAQILGRELRESGPFGLGLLKNSEVCVGVFPKSKEFGISGFCLGGIALQSIGSREAQAGERSDWVVEDDSSVLEDLLKLGGSFRTLMCSDVRLAAHVGGVAAIGVLHISEFIRRSRVKRLQRLGGIFMVEGQLTADCGQIVVLRLGILREALGEIVGERLRSGSAPCCS